MEKKKRQILFIHGGMTFKTHEDYIHYIREGKSIRISDKKSWNREWIRNELSNDFEYMRPNMPTFGDNCKYDEWKIYFERFIELFEDEIILMGESLGGTFLAQYLSENKFPKKIRALFLVCPAFDDDLIGEDLAGDFGLDGKDLSLIEKQCDNVTLMFSKDDDCVPISHCDKFRAKLSNCEFVVFESKNGHFDIEEFPEIVEMIKNVS